MPTTFTIKTNDQLSTLFTYNQEISESLYNTIQETGNATFLLFNIVSSMNNYGSNRLELNRTCEPPTFDRDYYESHWTQDKDEIIDDMERNYTTFDYTRNEFKRATYQLMGIIQRLQKYIDEMITMHDEWKDVKVNWNGVEKALTSKDEMNLLATTMTYSHN